MPFALGIPALLGSMGVAIPAAVTTGLSAAAGALGLAQGIAQKDPFGALAGAASGITGPLSSLGSISQPLAQGVQAGTQALSAQTPLDLAGAVGSGLQASGVAGQTMPHEISHGGDITKKSSLLNTIGNVIGGVGAAGSGVMGLINAFKGDQSSAGAHLGYGNLDTNLPSAPGARAGNLPNMPQLQSSSAGQVPDFDLTDPKNNSMLLKLLGAYGT